MFQDRSADVKPALGEVCPDLKGDSDEQKKSKGKPKDKSVGNQAGDPGGDDRQQESVRHQRPYTV